MIRPIEWVAFAAIAIVLGLLYAYWATHLLCSDAPDEHMRIKVPMYIVAHNSLPLGSDPEVIDALWGTSYAFSVYGSSLVAALPMKVVSLFTADPVHLLLAARMANVLMSLANLLVVFLIGARLSMNPTLKFLLVALVGLWPQYVFLAAYFNSDILEVLSTSLALLLVVKGIESRWALRHCVGLGVALGICALSYYYAYGTIVACVVVYYWTAFMQRRETSGAWHVRYLLKPLLIACVAFAVSGWFFIRNLALYGDFFGLNASAACSELFASGDLAPSKRMTASQQGYSMLDVLTGRYGSFLPWVPTTAKSFIGVFGYMTYYLPTGLYLAYCAIVGGGLVLALVGAIASKRRPRYFAPFLTGCLIMIAIPCFLSLYYSWCSDYQPQGRYLMAAFVPLMLLAARGWSLGPYRICEEGKTDAERPKTLMSAVRIILPCLLMAVLALLFCYVWRAFVAPMWLSSFADVLAMALVGHS